jgi:NADH-quinone oxidoreductase subunit K
MLLILFISKSTITVIIKTAIVLFLVGFCGLIFSRQNLILVLMSFELMLMSVNLLIYSFILYLDCFIGYLILFFILTCAAAETAIGLAFLIMYHRSLKSNSTKNKK